MIKNMYTPINRDGRERAVEGAVGWLSSGVETRSLVTGPVMDQATPYPELGDGKLQDKAATAEPRFVKSSSIPATQATQSQGAAQSRKAAI